jgi:hypothetical protein
LTDTSAEVRVGINSGNGMGAAKMRPGYRTFRGSAARMNAQAAITKLFSHLPPNGREVMERIRTLAWGTYRDPTKVHNYMVDQVAKADELLARATKP